MTPQSERKGAYIAARDKYFAKAVRAYIEDGGTLKQGLRIFYDAFDMEVDDTGPIPKAKLKKKPTIITKEELERRRQEEAERKKRISELVLRYSTSFGTPWGELGWHELPSMGRDGEIAKAIVAAGPAHVPNDGRRVYDVITKNRLHGIIDQAREATA